MEELLMHLQRKFEAAVHDAFPPNIMPYFDRDALLTKLMRYAHERALEVSQLVAERALAPRKAIMYLPDEQRIVEVEPGEVSPERKP